MMKKQVICGLVAALLTLSGSGTALGNAVDLHFEVTANAATVVERGTCGENLTWTLDDKGTLTISGTGKMNDYNKEIAPWKDLKVKTVILNDGVKNIGNKAFSDCKELESIIIPDSVTSISNLVFYGCSSLSSITIPNSVKTISQSAFYCCSSLSSITIPSSVTKISSYAFYGCTSLSSITIPNSVTTISDHAFAFCYSLTDITIPSSVTSINDWVFYGCTNLSNINLPDSITSIGSYSFDGCKSLESITIPKNVNTINDHAFFDCTSLSSITIPKSVKYVGGYSFSYCYDPVLHQINGFTIYCYEGTAGERYAKGNQCDYKLITNPIPAAVPGENCVTLTWKPVEIAEKYAIAVKVDDQWKIVDKTTKTHYTLSGLKAGTDYDVAVITMFNGEWFKNFENSIIVTPNKSVSKYPSIVSCEYSEEFHQLRLRWRKVEDAKEYGIAVKIANKWKVQALTDKTIFISPKVNPGSTFEVVVCAKVNGKWETDNLNSRAFTAKAIKEKMILYSGTCGENLTWTLDEDDTLTISGTGKMNDYNKEIAPWKDLMVKTVVINDGAKNIGIKAFSDCKAIESITIPDSVTSISEYAFYNCISLSDITIPDSITSIDKRTFSNCTSLSNITIPDTITSINEYAFSSCTSLSDITIPDSVMSIGKCVFSNCTSLSDITLSNSITTISEDTFSGCTNLSSITIPNSVRKISEFAFMDCTNLSNIIIPNSVRAIGNSAFHRCYKLKSLTIPASVKYIGWDIYAYDFNTDSSRPDCTIYCFKDTEGEKYAKDNFVNYVLLTNPLPAAVSGDNCVTLAWEASQKAEKYAIAVKVDDNWKIIEKTTNTTYTLRGLKTDTDYEVAVIAMFNGECYNDFSNAITVTPNKTVYKYPIVTDTEYNEEFHQFRLNWQAVESATEYGIAVKIAGKWKIQTCTDKTFFISPKLTPDSIIEMVICAKVNGKWDTRFINSRAFKVTVR
ncbi:MAG: leucine-rich repeat protein [Ruminococcus sp.]|uniref:leucine-rich repeat protein n=1 Tax=Ruminococcus sp. TaxID=41978 RepID=UPI0025D299C2|nr:leucine-rich repeat protein [Ruminococcus sp.]MBO4866472.1 leucine-rich repeat protein [Ruminococcus sp.]